MTGSNFAQRIRAAQSAAEDACKDAAEDAKRTVDLADNADKLAKLIGDLAGRTATAATADTKQRMQDFANLASNFAKSAQQVNRTATGNAATIRLCADLIGRALVFFNSYNRRDKLDDFDKFLLDVRAMHTGLNQYTDADALGNAINNLGKFAVKFADAERLADELAARYEAAPKNNQRLVDFDDIVSKVLSAPPGSIKTAHLRTVDETMRLLATDLVDLATGSQDTVPPDVTVKGVTFDFTVHSRAEFDSDAFKNAFFHIRGIDYNLGMLGHSAYTYVMERIGDKAYADAEDFNRCIMSIATALAGIADQAQYATKRAIADVAAQSASLMSVTYSVPSIE